MSKKKPSETIAALQKKINNVVRDVEVSEYFKKVPEIIRQRTREGYGITRNDGKVVSLPKLKDSTIAKRLRMEERGELSNETTPFFSNLTAEGILLDAMIAKKVGANKYEIGFDNRKKRNGVSPTQLKDYLEEKGFVFFGLAREEKELLIKSVGEKIESEIAKLTK